MKNYYTDLAKIKITEVTIKHTQAIIWLPEDTIPHHHQIDTYKTIFSTLNDIRSTFLVLKIRLYEFCVWYLCVCVCVCGLIMCKIVLNRSRCCWNELNIDSEVEDTGLCSQEDIKRRSGSEINNKRIYWCSKNCARYDSLYTKWKV